MRIYLIQNAETVNEEKGTIVSRSDDALTDLGNIQAKGIANQLAHVKIGYLYTSPAKSAVETADVICGQWDEADRPEIIADSRLLEQNFGYMNNSRRTADDFKLHREQLFARFPHGESFLDVVGRVYPFMDELKNEYEIDDNILIVTHRSPYVVIETYFHDMTEEELRAELDSNFRMLSFE